MEKGVPPCGNTPIDFYISNIFNVSATSWALHPTFPDRIVFLRNMLQHLIRHIDKSAINIPSYQVFSGNKGMHSERVPEVTRFSRKLMKFSTHRFLLTILTSSSACLTSHLCI